MMKRGHLSLAVLVGAIAIWIASSLGTRRLSVAHDVDVSVEGRSHDSPPLVEGAVARSPSARASSEPRTFNKPLVKASNGDNPRPPPDRHDSVQVSNNRDDLDRRLRLEPPDPNCRMTSRGTLKMP